MSLLSCLVMTSLLCLTWISLLTMLNVWLTKFKDLQGLVDPLHWHGYLFCYGVPSARLCNGVAMLARNLASRIVDCEFICALMVGWLIALDKCPGVHPIGVGEALRHIFCKVVALAIGPTWRICVVWFGCALDCEQVWRERFMLFVSNLICTVMIVGGILLVVARNAFNSVNHVAALWNAGVLWLHCFRFLFSSYRKYAQLFIEGSDIFCLVRKA